MNRKTMIAALAALTMILGLTSVASAATIYPENNPLHTYTWTSSKAGDGCTVDGQAGVIGYYNVNGQSVRSCVVGTVAPPSGGVKDTKAQKAQTSKTK